MLICRFLILSAIAIRYTHGTLKPNDVEAGWLTLATIPTHSQVEDKAGEIHFAGNQHAEQSQTQTLPTSDVPRATSNTVTGETHHEANIPSPGTSRYFKSPETRAKMRARWTEERKQKWGEKMRERNKKTPRFTSKGRKSTLGTREKISKKRMGMAIRPDTKIKISDTLKKFHAAKKANKAKSNVQDQ